MPAGPERPQFCPWCGSPIAYDEHDHEPRYESLTKEAGARGVRTPPLPDRVRDMLAGESFAGACSGCRTVSHVIGHKATGRRAR